MVAQKFYVDLDILRNQLLNARLHSDTTTNIDAALTVAGQIGFDTTLHRPKYHTGAVIREIASLDGTETLTNKTLTSPVINTQVTGDAIITYSAGGMAGTLGACSDYKVPSEKAVFAAISSGIGANDAMVYKGAINCSTEPNYPAADTGHTYKVSSAGKIGGASGPNVEAGDTLICTVDGSASGTHATVGANWNIIQYNVDILPTAKGGTGNYISPLRGDMLVSLENGSFNRLPKGADGYFLKMDNGMPAWRQLQLTNLYAYWVFQIDASFSYFVENLNSLKFISGTGISVTGIDNYDGTANATISLAAITGNSVLANASTTAGPPSEFLVTTSGVVGRLASGNITNIPFGTSANTIAWGDHTHAQLHNQTHALVGPDHTASGLTVGQFVIATGVSTFTWSNITIPNACTQGDIFVASASNTWTTLAKDTDGKVLTMVSGSPAWANPTSTYSYWTVADLTDSWNVQNGYTLNLLAANGLVAGFDISDSESTWMISLAAMNANSIMANATAASTTPSGFSVTSSGVVGRLVTGNITNIPFGTAANTVAWGDHSHVQLHNQVHALVGPDHSAEGLTAGQIVIATGPTTFAWSTITIPNACSQGDILFASASNTWTVLSKSTTTGHILKNTGSNNNPAWGAITLSDLPIGVPKYYVASYESGGSPITTLTVLASTHGCGLKPMVQFIETNGTTDYRVATAQILVDQASGDVTINTNVLTKGKVIIIGS